MYKILVASRTSGYGAQDDHLKHLLENYQHKLYSRS